MYRRDIDVLRAVAIGMVLVNHFFPRLAPAGFLGVDVFFTISGFLIFGNISRSLSLGTFSLSDFFWRRFRRIVPAATCVVVAAVGASEFLVFRPVLPAIASSAVASLASFQNLRFWQSKKDYWSPFDESSPELSLFLHFWSLSVEEQFYIGFPVLSLLLHRFGKKWVGVGVFGLAVVSLLCFLAWTDSRPIATFYLTPLRMWEMLLGAVAALLVGRAGVAGSTEDQWLRHAFSSFCLLCLCFVPFLDLTFGSSSFVAVTLTSVILAFGGFAPSVNVFVCNKITTWLGLRSYSLYLWHWPVLVLYRVYVDRSATGLECCILIAATCILSEASFRWVERPTRHWAGGNWVMFTAFLGLCGFLQGLSTIERVYDRGLFNRPRSYAFAYDLNPGNFADASAFERGVFRGVDCPGPRFSRDRAFDVGHVRGSANVAPQVVVLGDSQAVMLGGVFDEVLGSLGVTTSFWAMNGVSPFCRVPPVSEVAPLPNLSAEDLLQVRRAQLSAIDRWRPKLVILASGWWSKSEEEVWPLMQFLSERCGAVLIIESPPLVLCRGGAVADFLIFSELAGSDSATCAIPGWPGDEGRKLARRLSELLPNVELLETQDLFTRKEGVLAAVGRDLVYLDEAHLTAFGAGLLRDRLAHRVEGILETR